MQTVETSQYIDTEKPHAPSNACKKPQQNLTVEYTTAFGKHPTAIRLQRTLRLFVQFFHFLRKHNFIVTCSMQTFRTVPLGNYLYTAPLPPLANTLPQYGCNAFYACLYSFSIFCASIISSPTSLRTSSLHANSVYGGNILAVTAIPNALWRSALVAHTTAVCTVFPFPEQVLFHRPLIRGRILHKALLRLDLQLFWCNFQFR